MIKKYATVVTDQSAANQVQISDHKSINRHLCTIDSARADAVTQKTGNLQ